MKMKIKPMKKKTLHTYDKKNKSKQKEKTYTGKILEKPTEQKRRHLRRAYKTLIVGSTESEE